jgi:hypothetical protein
MSSLNSGPNGTKLLFDALTAMQTLSVSRNYLPFSQWRPRSSAILLLSLESAVFNSASKEDLFEIERLTKANNRVVFCIPDDSASLATDGKKLPLVKTRWGIQISSRKIGTKNDESTELVLDYDASWQPVKGLDDAVEKRVSNGGTVMAALHSDDFSNESLATDPNIQEEVPPLIGPYLSVVFDETHFGIEESGSIAGLARRYRLQGLVVGLLILACLFIWNRSVSFPPPTRFESRQDGRVLAADGRNTFAGLISQHLTPQVLIESCIAEWNRFKPRQQITTIPAGTSDPVSSYRQLQESLPKKGSRV